MKFFIILSVFNLCFLACQYKVDKPEIEKKTYIDTSEIETISIYCERFYNEINNMLFTYSQQKNFSESIQKVIETNHPYSIISDKDSVMLIKEIFFNNYSLIDSSKNNYQNIGDYFLLIKCKNGYHHTLSYISDSVWVYNQKYIVKYEHNTMYEFLKFQNIRGIDCFSTDSIKMIGNVSE